MKRNNRYSRPPERDRLDEFPQHDYILEKYTCNHLPINVKIERFPDSVQQFIFHRKTSYDPDCFYKTFEYEIQLYTSSGILCAGCGIVIKASTHTCKISKLFAPNTWLSKKKCKPIYDGIRGHNFLALANRLPYIETIRQLLWISEGGEEARINPFITVPNCQAVLLTDVVELPKRMK